MVGDYISRDATRSEVLKWADGYSYIEIPTETAIAQINVIPAADVVEVRHGTWLVTDAYPHNICCSECYETFAQEHWEIWQDGSLPRDYCPSCGAKMDGGQAE